MRDKRMLNFLSSMRLGLISLVLIAVVAAIGSALLPDIFYRTWWFQVLLLLLLLNMFLCTLKRGRVFWLTIISRLNMAVKLKHTGIFFLHTSFLLILLGGMFYSFGGETGRLSISKGEKVPVSKVLSSDKALTVRLDDFNIDYYRDGSPSQFRSQVTLLEHQREVGSHEISVNNPVKYKGIKIYQESYGWLVQTKLTDSTGDESVLKIQEGNWIYIPDSDYRLNIYRYIPDYDPVYGMNSKSLKPLNPRVIFSVYHKEKRIGVGIAEFGEKVQINDNLYVTFTGVCPFSTFKVKTDPGAPVVAVGGGVLVLGVILYLLQSVRIKEKSIQEIKQ